METRKQELKRVRTKFEECRFKRGLMIKGREAEGPQLCTVVMQNGYVSNIFDPDHEDITGRFIGEVCTIESAAQGKDVSFLESLANVGMKEAEDHLPFAWVLDNYLSNIITYMKARDWFINKPFTDLEIIDIYNYFKPYKKNV